MYFREIMDFVYIAIIIVIFFLLLSFFCRGLKHAYNDHLESAQRSRSRTVFAISDQSIDFGLRDPRTVHIAAITSRNGECLSMNVYEIRVPQNQNRPGRNSSRSISSSPPPFSSAVLMPIKEDDPPSYDDYLKTVSNPNSTIVNINPNTNSNNIPESDVSTNRNNNNVTTNNNTSASDNVTNISNRGERS